MKNHFLTIPYLKPSQLPAIGRYCSTFLENHKSLTLRQITATFFTAFQDNTFKIIIPIKKKSEIIENLKKVEEGHYTAISVYPEYSTNKSDKTAFFFTGGGAQYPKMGKHLYDKEPVFKNAIDQCADIAMNYLESDIRKVLFSGKTTKEGRLLNRIDYMQMTLFAYEYAMFSLWSSRGVKPDVVIGHSIGEIIASCVAGIFSIEDAIKLTCLSGELVETYTEKGQMVVVQANECIVSDFVKDYKTSIGIAVVNSPLQTVISGNSKDLKEVLYELESRGYETKTLKISHAFHSPLMLPALKKYKKLIKSLKINLPKIKMISCITGKEVDEKVLTLDYWTGHLMDSVKFSEGIQKLSKYEISKFIEVGPNPVLLGIIEQHPDIATANILQLSSADNDEPLKFYESIQKWMVEGGQVKSNSFYNKEDVCRDKFDDLFKDIIQIMNTSENKKEVILENQTTLSRMEIQLVLKEKIAKILLINEVSDLSLNIPLKELGLTSIKALKLVKELSKSLEKKITVSHLFDYPTIEFLTDFLISNTDLSITQEFSEKSDKKDDDIEQYIVKINDMSLDELEFELQKELDLLNT
ncbi:acyltransferase domain-containing protein [Aquimarina sp. BL5]|uniref:acyltransferase domain-containing protein n=1 Tax=Aquimarina sp. BL5 TaxID=1714860 RepID=UPI000E4E950E|nr:acyltransferase domain-containing protein [Aquimarina sp. BL5]AXT51942.1 acyltransferase domain-containing protein [Aquimarina sp. BL5]RKN02899.1 acyltransferase domain-containing protein [Aquimarina sp. BL5]